MSYSIIAVKEHFLWTFIINQTSVWNVVYMYLQNCQIELSKYVIKCTPLLLSGRQGPLPPSMYPSFHVVNHKYVFCETKRIFLKESDYVKKNKFLIIISPNYETVHHWSCDIPDHWFWRFWLLLARCVGEVFDIYYHFSTQLWNRDRLLNVFSKICNCYKIKFY